MEGSRDRGGTERSQRRGSGMWQQQDSLVAGSRLWIGLKSVACWSSAAPWKLGGVKLWARKPTEQFSITPNSLIEQPLLSFTCLSAFPLYLCLSPPLYFRSPPYCSESRFSLSKWPDCFSAGEFTSDAYTEAWTGPQAMPAIDFTMILIKGPPVAIDTIHQWTAQWNWWSQIGSHIWFPINHAVDYF